MSKRLRVEGFIYMSDEDFTRMKDLFYEADKAFMDSDMKLEAALYKQMDDIVSKYSVDIEDWDFYDN